MLLRHFATIPYLSVINLKYNSPDLTLTQIKATIWNKTFKIQLT